MRIPAIVLLGLVILLVAIGGWQKIGRYATAPARASDGAIGAITTVMEADGWRRTALEHGPRIPFTSLAFDKAGCTRQIVIAILGRNAELVPLVRMVHGDDIWLGDGDGLPFLAVAPRSALAEPGCTVPIRHASNASIKVRQ